MLHTCCDAYLDAFHTARPKKNCLFACFVLFCSVGSTGAVPDSHRREAGETGIWFR